MLAQGSRGLKDLHEKSFTKVKLFRTGKLNRTICRIGNFWDPKTLHEIQRAAVRGFVSVPITGELFLNSDTAYSCKKMVKW